MRRGEERVQGTTHSIDPTERLAGAETPSDRVLVYACVRRTAFVFVYVLKMILVMMMIVTEPVLTSKLTSFRFIC